MWRFTGALALSLAAALPGCKTSIGGPASDDSGPAPVDANPGTEPEPDAASTADAAPPDARPPCDQGDDRIEDPGTGACYLYFQAALSWADAEAACAALGGHLAAVTSLGENAFLSQIAPAAQDIWIGASDDASEDDFTWVTGEPFGFTHWREGEPNNGGGDGDAENCAVIEGDNNVPGEGCLWDDRPCDDDRSYLCERP